MSWGDQKTGWEECEELVEGEEGEGMDEEEGGVFTITEEEEGRGKGGRRKEGRRVSWGKGGRRKEGRRVSCLGETRKRVGRSVKNWWKARKERGWMKRREGVLP